MIRLFIILLMSFCVQVSQPSCVESANADQITSPAPPPPSRFTPQLEREALDFIQLIAPFRLDDLKQLKNANLDEYHRRLREVLDAKHNLDFARSKDPEAYELMIREAKMDQQSQYLSEQYHRAKQPADRDRIRRELKTLLDQLFDIREQNKAREIQRIEQELAQLKQTMNDRRKNKGQIVQIRLDEMLGTKTSLRW